MDIEIEVIKPLYPQEGGPALAYRCNDRSNGKACKMVTRTRTGMWTHLRIVHGVVRQPKLPLVVEKEATVEHTA